MLVSCCIAAAAFCQEGYRAIFSGGKVYLKTETRFQQVLPGQQMPADAKVELVGESMLVLMDGAGRITSFSLSGKYDLAALNLADVADSSAFIRQVWDEYFEHSALPTSVEEALLAESLSTQYPFELTIPSSTQVFGNRLHLNVPGSKRKSYQAQLINEFGEVFENVDVTEGSISLDLLRRDLVWKPEITLRIASADGAQSGPFYVLDKLSPANYEIVERLMRKHFHDPGFEMQLTQLAFFENRWLFADALTILNDLEKEYGGLMKEFSRQYFFRNGFYAMSKE